VTKRTKEFERIEALPRRKLADKLADKSIVDKWTKRLKTPEGTMVFRDVQAVGFEEAYTQDGGFFPINVGGGKTLLSACLPAAMYSRKAVILVPPKLYEKTLREFKEYSKHFRIDMSKIEVPRPIN